MNKLDAWITEWANDVLRRMDKSEFSGINVIEKILRDPGISTGGSRDRILWWPKNRRLAEISRAMHQVPPVERICLVVKFGRPVNDDGTIFTDRHLAQNSSVGVRDFKKYIRFSRKKLRGILLNSKPKPKKVGEKFDA